MKRWGREGMGSQEAGCDSEERQREGGDKCGGERGAPEGPRRAGDEGGGRLLAKVVRLREG
jgi:hypothetical protein